MSSGHWHFRRTPFSQETFGAMVNGPSRAFTLFGPRRMGKTEWLREDLAEIASMYRHRVAYASLWQIETAPLNVLLYRLHEALSPRSFAERLAAWVTSLPIKAKIRTPDGTAEVEIDLSATAPPPSQKDFLLLDAYCQALSDTAKPAFLIFDEVQQLATHPDGKAIVAALRTSLDTAGRGLVSVFTGSSMEGLHAMFSRNDAPFFNFAAPLILEPLGEAFFEHQVRAFRVSFGRDVDRTAARARFAQCDGNPELFQRWLQVLGQSPGLTPEDAARITDEQFSVQQDFDKHWRAMTLIHRQMARMIAEGVHGLFGQGGAERIGKWTPDDIPSKSVRQSAQRWLARNGHIERWDGDWTLADPAFARWVLARPEADFR